MSLNVELLKSIAQQIIDDPERFSMSFWGYSQHVSTDDDGATIVNVVRDRINTVCIGGMVIERMLGNEEVMPVKLTAEGNSLSAYASEKLGDPGVSWLFITSRWPTAYYNRYLRIWGEPDDDYPALSPSDLRIWKANIAVDLIYHLIESPEDFVEPFHHPWGSDIERRVEYRARIKEAL